MIGETSRPWLRYFFCYVWNQELDEGKNKDINDDVNPVKLSALRRSVETVFMLEIRTSKDELPSDDPYQYKEISRSESYPHGDWNKDGLIWNPFGMARSRKTN